MKKIFLRLLGIVFVLLLLGAIFIYIDYVQYRSSYSHLNKFEKELVKRIEKYSLKSKEIQKESIIYLSQLTDKKFERVETIGCYELHWNETAKLPANLEEKVNEKIGIPEDFFTTLLLINKNDVIVLKLHRGVGDLMPGDYCKNFENCYIKFTPKEEFWQGEKYIHQGITISDSKN